MHTSGSLFFPQKKTALNKVFKYCHGIYIHDLYALLTITGYLTDLTLAYILLKAILITLINNYSQISGRDHFNIVVLSAR